MKTFKLTAVVIAAIAALQCTAGCGKKDEKKSDDTANVSTTEAATSGFDGNAYYDKVMSAIEKQEVSKDAPQLSTLGEPVTPEEGSDESNLGAYRLSSNGVKLYYNSEEFSDNLMLTLEQYFLSFPANDYTKYTSCVFPSYIDEMGAFLEKDYSYDLKTSFAKQCVSLASRMNGDYKITRIRLEKPEQYTEGVDNLENYFKSLDDVFGKSYYEQVKGESDNIVDACFYVIGEDANGNETPIISGYEIVFAEKDGRFYTFG
jgi:hypothetical protein